MESRAFSRGRLGLSRVSEELKLFKGQAGRGFDAPLGGVGGMTVAMMSQKHLCRAV